MFTFLLISIVGVLTPFNFADAVVHGKISEVLNFLLGIPFLVFLGPLKIVLILLGPLLSIVPVFLSSMILKWVTSDYFIALPYTSGGIVDVGWTLMRDVANLFLVIILIVIAVNTIRGETQGGARLIPKLILIALIINFSKVMAGVVVDFANIIMTYFLTLSRDLYKEFINFAIENSFLDAFINFSPEKILGLIKEVLSLSGMVESIIKTVGLIIFSMLISLTLTVFSGLFIVRYIAIWILVITMPLALVSSILPYTAQFARKWWQQFTSWAFIGIGPAFVLFLTMKLVSLARAGGIFEEDYADKISDSIGGAGGAAFEFFVEPILDIMVDMFVWLIIIIFMLFALQQALSINAQGASVVTKLGRKGLAKLQGAGIGTLKGMGRQMSQRAVRLAREPARQVAGFAGKAGRAGLGAVGGAIKRPGRWNAQRQYNKNKQKWVQEAGIAFQPDRRGMNVTSATPWNNLTPEQQKIIMQKQRGKIAKGAARYLGAGAKVAQKIATYDWNQLTPEQQRAIITVIATGKLRKAQKGDVQKKMQDYKDKGLDDKESLKRTIQKAGTPSEIMAAKLLYLQQIDSSERKNPATQKLLGDEKAIDKLVQDAKRLGMHNEILSYHSDLIERMYPGTDPESLQKKARAMRNALSKADAEISTIFKDIESLLDDQLKELAKSGNAHQRIAAARRLAETHSVATTPTTKQLTDGKAQGKTHGKILADVKSEAAQTLNLELARQFGQEHRILQRYPQLCKDETEMQKTLSKMPTQEGKNIDTAVLDVISDPQTFKWFYKSVPSAIVREMLMNKELREALSKVESVAEHHEELKGFIQTENEDVRDYLLKEHSKGNAFSIPWL